jgi:hypothetical protein
MRSVATGDRMFFLLGEGTEASGVWIGRRGLIGFMQTGCFGLLGFFAAPVCKHSYFL